MFALTRTDTNVHEQEGIPFLLFDVDETLRLDAESLLERARSFVGYYVIVSRPAADEISIDRHVLTVADGRPTVLAVGDHVLEARAAGYSPVTRVLHTRGGESERVDILFTLPAQAAAQSAPRHRWRKSPWLWTAVGAVVAGAIVGTTLALRGGPTREQASDGGSTNTVLQGPKEMAR